MIDSTITFHQLNNFLLNSKIIDDSFTIETATNEILSEENLSSLIAEAVRTDSPIQIIFKAKAACPQLEVSEPPAQSVILPIKVEPIGPTMRSILEKIGVNFDLSALDDVQKCLGSLPFPYSFLFKQYLEQIKANPNVVHSIAEQIAQMFSVDEKTLLAEVNVALDYINNPPAPEPIVQKAEPEIAAPKIEEVLQESAKPVIGPILAKILKENFEVEESCLHSHEEIRKVVNELPFFRILLASAENPNILQFFATGLAYRFSVDREKVNEELKQLSEILRAQPQECTNQRGNQTSPDTIRRVNRPARCNKWRSRSFHPATCDSCKAMISGIRYYCLHCKNFDLCSTCEQKNTDAPFHDESHIFAKIRDPATPYRIEELINPNTSRLSHPRSFAHTSFRNPIPAVRNEHSHSNSQPEDYTSPWFKRFAKRAEAAHRLDQLEASVKQLKETVSQLQNA